MGKMLSKESFAASDPGALSRFRILIPARHLDTLAKPQTLSLYGSLIIDINMAEH